MAKTRLQIREKVMKDLDLLSQSGSYVKGADHISPEEINDHINDGIKYVSSFIHNLYEDYYLTISSISFVNGTRDYSLPNNMYINKIRRLTYDNTANEYPICRITNISELQYIESNDDYRYLMVNDGTSEKIRIFPTPRETEANIATLYYCRRAKELTSDTDTLDLPEEFDNVLITDVEYRCLLKEPGNPMFTIIENKRKEEMEQMIKTLSKRTPDDQSDLRPDYSFYVDSIA